MGNGREHGHETCATGLGPDAFGTAAAPAECELCGPGTERLYGRQADDATAADGLRTAVATAHGSTADAYAARRMATADATAPEPVGESV